MVFDRLANQASVVPSSTFCDRNLHAANKNRRKLLTNVAGCAILETNNTVDVSIVYDIYIWIIHE